MNNNFSTDFAALITSSGCRKKSPGLIFVSLSSQGTALYLFLQKELHLIVPPNVFLYLNYDFNRNSIVMAEKELFEETGYFKISNETSYRSRSSLVIHKLGITCLENNEAKKLVSNEQLVSNEPVATTTK